MYFAVRENDSKYAANFKFLARYQVSLELFLLQQRCRRYIRKVPSFIPRIASTQTLRVCSTVDAHLSARLYLQHDSPQRQDLLSPAQYRSP